MLNHGLHLLSTVESRVDPDLQKFWDPRLTSSKQNPYPLAPKDLVEGGFVSPESYRRENNRLRRFCKECMEKELSSMTRNSWFRELPRGIVCLGGGLGRDLGWVKEASKNFSVHVYDNSKVACRHVRNILREKKCEDVEVIHGEIGVQWDNGDIDLLTTIVMYAVQFIQVQPRERMQHFMRKLGAFLKEPVSRRYPFKRRAYILHPFGRDNNRLVKKWGATTPYEKEELLEPAEQGFGGKLEIKVLGKHPYFHQRYTFFKLIGG